MFKFIRNLFLITVIFFGLYFFADFRINDTNVRDYLQTTVTLETFVRAKNKVVHVYSLVMEVIETVAQKQSGSNKLTESDEGSDLNRAKKVIHGEPIELITTKDHKELVNILKTSLQQSDKSKK